MDPGKAGATSIWAETAPRGRRAAAASLDRSGSLRASTSQAAIAVSAGGRTPASVVVQYEAAAPGR